MVRRRDIAARIIFYADMPCARPYQGRAHCLYRLMEQTMVLEVKGLALSYGADVVLRDVTFQVNESDRIAVAGYNGCGKTTLLNILTGEMDSSAGSFTLKSNATMGYLKQTIGLKDGNTVYTEMKSVGGADRLLARMKELERTMGADAELVAEYETVSARYEAIDGYNLDFNIKRILSGMSFAPDSYDKGVTVLSGGEKTRLALAKLLIMQPDLLVLDEPTNHLDIETMEWLEQFLSGYKGAIILVSHDRYFLDHVSTRTLEIMNGIGRMYTGNFTAYISQREHNETREQQLHERTLAEAEKLRDYAQRNIARASTSKMAKSRLKMLDKLDTDDIENTSHIKVKFAIQPLSEPYKEVITAKDLTISIGGRTLIKDLDFELLRGEHLAIIGSNGTGKTTLLKTLLGRHAPQSGRLRMGGGVKLGYLEQNLFGIKADNPIGYIWDLYPSMTQLEIRNLLASVGFRGEDVFTPAAGLSGGELARLNLARISLEHPNLLILDEPTNHLDIYTKDMVYEALGEYGGTMVVVTHDRHLIEAMGCRILVLNGQTGRFYRDYAAYCGSREDTAQNAPDSERKTADEKPQRATQPLPEIKKQPSQKELRQERAKERERRIYLEVRIEELEEDIAYLQAELEKPETVTDHEKLSELCGILDGEREELAALSEEWLQNYAD